MWSKANINFKISHSTEKYLFKPSFLAVDVAASIVDMFCKYFTVIWDSVPFVGIVSL